MEPARGARRLCRSQRAHRAAHVRARLAGDGRHGARREARGTAGGAADAAQLERGRPRARAGAHAQHARGAHLGRQAKRAAQPREQPARSRAGVHRAIRSESCYAGRSEVLDGVKAGARRLRDVLMPGAAPGWPGQAAGQLGPGREMPRLRGGPSRRRGSTSSPRTGEGERARPRRRGAEETSTTVVGRDTAPLNCRGSQLAGACDVWGRFAPWGVPLLALAHGVRGHPRRWGLCGGLSLWSWC